MTLPLGTLLLGALIPSCDLSGGGARVPSPPPTSAAAPLPAPEAEGGSPEGTSPAGPAPGPVAGQAGEATCDATVPSGATAQDLNTAGYRCYKAGQLAEAATLFRAAVGRDDTHALAHYNLACTLALLRQREPACVNGATFDEILDHLERAVALDPGRRARMRQDADLAEIRGTLRYKVLDGARLDDPAALSAALAGTRFYAPPTGAFGSLRTVDLVAGGVLLLRERVLDPQGAPGGWSDEQRTWHLDGTNLQLLDRRYTVDPTGDLLDGTARAWLNLPPECGA